MMLLHRRIGAHTVEEFEFLAVALDYFAAALIVAREQAADHHKICATADRLRYVARIRAAAVRHYVTVKTVRRVCTPKTTV